MHANLKTVECTSLLRKIFDYTPEVSFHKMGAPDLKDDLGTCELAAFLFDNFFGLLIHNHSGMPQFATLAQFVFHHPETIS